MKVSNGPEKIDGLPTVRGVVRWDDGDLPIASATVELYSRKERAGKPIATAKTDEAGRYVIRFENQEKNREFEKGGDYYIAVKDQSGRVLVSTHETPLRASGQEWEVSLHAPGRGRLLPGRGKKETIRPQIEVGPLTLDLRAVDKAKPEVALTLARALVNPKTTKRALAPLLELSPILDPRNLVERTLCGTSVLVAIDELIRIKRWPRDIGLEVDHILKMRDFGFAEETYECPNFIITYQTSGPAAVDPDTSAQDVIDPGSSPPVIIGSLPAGGPPPTYIKRICFWLERALAAYVSPPFSMLNPAAAGKIPVVVNSSPYGSASPSGTFYLNNALNADIMCAVAVHELFHMVQFEYGGTGTWWGSVLEGGAVFAEDTAADLMNRYLDEAGSNFNGDGVMIIPNMSLSSASYKCSLFWRYISEQQSADLTEPFIGVETYRTIIEHCSAGSYSTDDVKNAIRSLPWYQDFYEFSYLDPARLDRLSSETTLGNYALACYLKDLGSNVPDSRFDFIEDEENIFIDQVIPGAPSQTTLASVTLAGTGTVTTSTSASFSSSVNNLAHRYYEVTVDPAVTNVEVQFTAGSGLTSLIFQIVQIDEDNAVRDINRTDATNYTKRVTSLRGGKKLSKLLLVVTGGDSSGSFTLSASSAAASSDVMVTRWHSVMKNEYEIDSRFWAWTWVSPDIWVDNNGDGVADSEVFFNTNNQLHIRLHNKGNAAASGIQVDFYYQDASGGLSNAGWLPVQDTGGTTQVLTGLTLAAGASNDFTVNWSPSPSGLSNHFCIRAIVTVPGDPNTDNKRVLSNFGNVVMPFRKFIDISLIRRNLLDRIQAVTLQVIPRVPKDFEVSLRDIKQRGTLLLRPGEITQDTIRIEHLNLRNQVVHEHLSEEHHHLNGFNAKRSAKKLERSPDPRGFYPADPRTLPPGVAGRPMVTIVHEVNGIPQGGVTFLLTLDNEKRGAVKPKTAGKKAVSAKSVSSRRAVAKRGTKRSSKRR